VSERPANTVLVTGAFGQVGKRCSEILLERGRTVVAMDIRNDKTVAAGQHVSDQVHPGTLVPAYVDLLDEGAVRDLVAEHQPEAIVHLAGILAPASYLNPRLARRVNVEGTANLVQAAKSLAKPPLIVQASSAAVYGSRNPHRHPERITAQTPVNPIDQYGEDKVLAETLIRDSGLPYATLRLGAVLSPDAASTMNGDHLVLARSTPGDNRMHGVDARDVALAFANAVDGGDAVRGKILLIGGDESYVLLQRALEDDLMAAVGIGRLGPSASLPGDPNDDRGWSFTGWLDTSEAQNLLGFQQHNWSDTVAWVAESQGRLRVLLRVLGPVLRPAMRAALAVQRRREGRGLYADPWALIAEKYGPDVLAPTTF
jgi:nucleoside-diphosphate-sugar epimerase